MSACTESAKVGSEQPARLARKISGAEFFYDTHRGNECVYCYDGHK
jgi:hypothetical protein